ncbi:hypothetical protein [Nocardioides sp. SYSU D00065]|uniref:hypothetical protein n=1 Tax=Nocardioides sp. SYSU D00065 TaxID=2817378 RepID=UPI001B3239FF|nr:hypothetical protein [Nocardioides sp. SYSU D00065]
MTTDGGAGGGQPSDPTARPGRARAIVDELETKVARPQDADDPDETDPWRGDDPHADVTNASGQGPDEPPD